MEGSTNNKNVKNYETLAKYYDLLLQDKDAYRYWLSYIEEEAFDSCLELASGDGVLAGILKEKGYDITASDISSEMKEASRVNFDGDYILLNMIDYHLSKKYDLILCCCDSINYLEEEELDSFFACAYEHLKQGGRLLFDMHNVKRLKEFETPYIEEGNLEDIQYQWMISSDIEDSIIAEHFTFYTKQGMIQENHTQHVFEISLMLDKMNCYFDTRVMEDFIEDEKVLLIGRRK